MSFASSHKDPVSMKLRVANMKSSEVEGRTRQLEEESRQMEDRLKELKLTMNREKELREQRGGGHWKSGKEGNLNSHAKDVLKKAPVKPKVRGSSKGRKVKVLKDEPVISSPKTKDKARPGTLAFIAQRDNKKPGLRPTGPICGQCDIKSAVTMCQECSEVYCSGCFTAFHLKGALAKHHSVPLSKITATPRGNDSVFSEPPTMPSSGARQPPHERNRITWEEPHRSTVIIQQKDIEEESGQSSLLDGDYNEKEAAQSFQQALAEWRKENTDPKPSPTVTSTRNLKKPTLFGSNEPNIQTVSPVHTPRVNVDEGTSTLQGSTKPATDYQPEFTSSELSYAEKLLLKKNRRSVVPSLTPTPTANQINGYMVDHSGDDLDGTELEEPILFENILATVQESKQGYDNCLNGFSTTALEIEEVSEGEPHTTSDNESHYLVFEDVIEPKKNSSPTEERVYPTVVPAPTALFQKNLAPSVLQRVGGESVSSSLELVDISDSIDISKPASARKSTRARTPHKQVGAHKTSPSDRQRAESRNLRPASGLARPKSRSNTSFHRGSRPRTAAEKAADICGVGTLTKHPSPSLTDLIAKYKNSGQSHGYTSNQGSDVLAGFFTAGVKAAFTERTLTPRKEKPQSPGQPLKKHQISNKVYTLGSKSWRPESSLGGNVQEEEVKKIWNEFDYSQLEKVEPPPETTISYSWSASQSSGDAIPNFATEQQSFAVNAAEASNLTNPIFDRNIPSYSSTRGNVQGSPRQSESGLGVRRTKTEYTVTNRTVVTPRRSKTPLIVDGDDMTRYDNVAPIGDQEDMDTMHDLEVELASQTGRLTADGSVSRLLLDSNDNEEGTISPKRSLTPDTHRNIDRLRDSIMDDFEETELLIMQDEAMRVSLL
ncbi:uncharacterized protein [Watersipora subatra]|uniref:uncharacterized protein n=1 Tax=Watersipora subatra TaxID=2589382 RepID=UPI00355C0B06